MSGHVGIFMAPALGVPVLPLLVIGGAVVLATSIVSTVIKDRIDTNRRNSIARGAAACRDELLALIEKLKSMKCREHKSLDVYFREIQAGYEELVAAIAEAGDFSDDRAADKCNGVLCRVKRAAGESERAIALEMMHLRNSLVSRIDSFRHARRLLQADMAAMSGLKSPAALKLREETDKFLNEIDIPDPPTANFLDISPAFVAEFSAVLDSAEKSISAAFEKMAALKSAASREALAGTLKGIPQGRIKTVDEAVAEWKERMAPSKKELDVIRKAEKLLVELAFMKNRDEFATVEKKYGNVRAEENHQKRLMLYEDLLIFCDGLLKSEKRRRDYLDELTEMKRQVMAFDRPKSMQMVPEIDELLVAKSPVPLDDFKKRLAAAMSDDAEAANRENYGEIVKKSFEDLGYETDEDFETILVQNQKAFIKKPSMKNYYIQVVSNANAGILQAEVVRTVDTEKEIIESTRSDEVRDVEVETEFCSDYAKVLNELDKKGVAVTHKLFKKPGEEKVKKVLASSIGKKSSKRKAAPQAEQREIRKK